MFEENENNVNENTNDQSNTGGTGVNQAETTQVNDSADNSHVEKTFTQQQVNTMMAKEKRQGRDSAFRELGIDPNNEKMMSMFKSFIESQNAGIDPEEKIAKVQSETIKAEQRAQLAETKLEAIQLGVSPQYVDDVVTLVTAKLGLNEDLDLKSALTELKSKYPIWFTTETGGTDDKNKSETGQQGTGSSISTSSGTDGNGGAQSLGARLAAKKREANKVSGDFWK